MKPINIANVAGNENKNDLLLLTKQFQLTSMGNWNRLEKHLELEG